jgi:hypothetical protein
MARIRTIKPEFPQSESMGRISRDARLLFIQLWTIVDDDGRTRAASRMLASLLYPYDDDAPKLIDAWIGELEGEGCIVRYQVDGATYLEIRNWLNHQRIDKPSVSKLPPFDESSRILAKPRESSTSDLDLDLVPRKGKDLGARERARATEGLDLGTWDRWVEYRTAIKKPIKPPSMEAAAKEMAALGDGQAAAVQNSIANGYQGLVQPKSSGPSGTTKYERNIQRLRAPDATPAAANFLLTGTKP